MPSRRASAVVAVALLAAPGAAFAKSTTETLGDVGQIVLPATGLAVAAFHRDGKGVVQLAEAFGTTLAVVYILKPTVDRTRPNGGSQSFPSGHAASAFAGAAFLQIRYGWGWGVPAYAAAAFVALQSCGIQGALDERRDRRRCASASPATSSSPEGIGSCRCSRCWDPGRPGSRSGRAGEAVRPCLEVA